MFSTPVITVSADESLDATINDFGAIDVIEKPFGVDQVIEKVRLFLSRGYPFIALRK